MRLSVTRFPQSIRAPFMTMLFSISVLAMRTWSPMLVYGLMYVSGPISQWSPIMTGPRIVVLPWITGYCPNSDDLFPGFKNRAVSQILAEKPSIIEGFASAYSKKAAGKLEKVLMHLK